MPFELVKLIFLSDTKELPAFLFSKVIGQMESMFKNIKFQSKVVFNVYVFIEINSN